MTRRDRLEKILYHLGKGIWKQIPVIGPIVEEVVYEANRDLLLKALEEGSIELSDQDLMKLEELTQGFEDRLSHTLANEFCDLHSRLQEMEDRIRAPKLLATFRVCKSQFASMGLALSNYYGASIALRLKLLAYTQKNPDYQSYFNEPLPRELMNEAQETANRMRDLSAVVSAIQTDDFSSSCWRRSVSATTGAVADLVHELIKHGYVDSEINFDMRDLATLSTAINMAANRRESGNFSDVLMAVAVTNVSSQAGFGYDHASLRDLIYAGNSILHIWDESKSQTGTSLVASIGTAVLLDLFDFIPDRDIVLEELAERYPSELRLLDEGSLNLSRESFISSSLAFAVAELRLRPSLLLLQVPGKRGEKS